jgi:hypothetical protein
MKTQRYTGTPEKLQDMLEEYLMIGYDAEIIENELIVYYGKRPVQQKSKPVNEKTERWSKRERNFGYTRER